jgi:hypothetical protein
MGLVALQAEVDALRARVAALEDEVCALVSRETRQHAASTAPRVDSVDNGDVDRIVDSRVDRVVSTEPEDRKAYQRQWARERRAAKAASSSNVVVLRPRGAATKALAFGAPAVRVG